MANELRVRQNWLGGLIEDNPLTNAATAFNSAALAAAVAIGSTQHMPVIFDPDGLYGEPEIAWITAHTAGATSATLLRGQEGSTARQHQQDVRWTHGPTTQDLAVGRMGIVNDTGGDITTSLTTTWASLHATRFDVVVKAQPGDLIEVGGTNRFSLGGDNLHFDMVSIVSGSPVNQWATGAAFPSSTTGGGSLFLPSSYSGTLSFSKTRRCVAADLSGGTITLRAYWRNNGTTQSQTMFASTTGLPAYFYVRNNGAQEG